MAGYLGAVIAHRIARGTYNLNPMSLGPGLLTHGFVIPGNPELMGFLFGCLAAGIVACGTVACSIHLYKEHKTRR